MWRWFLIAAQLLSAPAGAQRLVALHSGNAVLDFSALGSGEYAYINFFKTCGRYSISSGSAFAYPAILDANGYITSAPSAQLQCVINHLTPNGAGTSEWVVAWSGTYTMKIETGTVSVVSDPGNCVTGTSGGLAVTGTNCRVLFNDTIGTPGNGATILFPTNGTYSGASSAYLCLASEESLLLAGQMFRPAFLNLLQGQTTSLNPIALRFLNWNGTAGLSLSRFGYRNLTTGFSAVSTTWPGDKATTGPWGGTMSGGDTYTGSAPPDWPGLIDGATVQYFTTNANTTTTPTLNVGGTGAVTILNGAFTSSPTASTLAIGAIAANSVGTFVYDAELNGWMYQSNGLFGGVPVEDAVALCNAISSNLWWNTPGLFDGPSITEQDDYIRDHLNSNLKFYNEWSNETFNVAATPWQWLNLRGAARGFPSGNNQQPFSESALRQRIAFGIGLSEWTSKRNAASMFMIFSPQTAGGNSSQVDNYLLQGQDLTLDINGAYTTGSGLPIVTNYSVQGPCNTGTTSGRPIDCENAMALAPYINGAQIGATDGNYSAPMTAAIAAADNYNNGSGTAAQIASALAFVDSDVRIGLKQTSQAVIATSSISGNTLTVGSVSSGSLTVGAYLTDATHTQPFALITAGSGLSWTVTPSQTVSSETMTASYVGGVTEAAYTTATGNSGFLSEGWYGVWLTLATKYNLSMFQYEGGFQELAPTSSRLTTLGITTSANCGTAACISAEFTSLITAYKNSGLFYQLTLDHFNSFLSVAAPNAKSVAWFQFGPGGDQWSMVPAPDINATPYQNYQAFQNFTIALPYLLNRDLDPASNDNSPAFLAKVA
jgi:hypothetical protein